MKRLLTILFLLILSPVCTRVHAAPLQFANGYYTNLCGTGTAATANTCNKGCDPATGSCTSTEKPFVIKWTCNGNMQDCRMNESGFASTQSVGNTLCGQTVKIDVYNRNCRTYFGWICNEANLQDSMTWYSGDCAAPPATTTPTASASNSPTQQSDSACQELTVTKGNAASVPSTVSFSVQSAGATRTRIHFGDGQQSESPSLTQEHRYDVSGTFVAKAFIQTTNGSWVSSPRCETMVTVKPSALETQKSDCSDVFIVDGNDTIAPTTVSIRVTGYDNKGAIQSYKITKADGSTLENSTGAFQMQFTTAGSFPIHGAIRDSLGNWKSGNEQCTKTVITRTTPLVTQPDTGTPTLLTISAIAGGITGALFLLASRLPLTKKHRLVRRAVRSKRRVS